jgi:hypothetical protein
MNVNGEEFGVGYWPGDSRSGMVSDGNASGSRANDSLVETRIGEDLFGSLSTCSLLRGEYGRGISWA